MGTTPKGTATRRRILDAAWELSDERGAEIVLGGVTLREVATRVGMTPSAVAYHFPTMGALGLAMIEHLVDTASVLPIDAVDDLLSQAGDQGLVAVVRLAAQTNWQMLCEPNEVDFERRLARCYAATGNGEHADAVKELIGSMTASWVETLAQTYRRTAETMGVRTVEPFGYDELARGAMALSEGLLFQWMWEPDAIRHDLAADLLVAMVSAALVPAPNAVALAERAAVLPGPLTSTDLESEFGLELAVATAPLFSNGVRPVSFTEVGRALDVGPEVLSARFGTIEILAALSFHRHLESVQVATQRRQRAGPAVSLTDGVYELSRAATADPHCALALLHERQRAAVAACADQPDQADRPGRDVCTLVPFGDAFAGPLSELVDRPDSDLACLAEMVVDTTLGHAATNPRRPLTQITESVLRLVPAEF
jgi:AcrR family transcriptional regulator